MDKMFDNLQEIHGEMVAWRRHLHRNPELSFREEKTAEFIRSVLASFGIRAETGVGGHGLTAIVKGEAPGPTVALRADIDALPIHDEKSCDYASTVPGVMHACGHDGHTAVLLGLAKWFQANRSRIAGQVRLIFQPAEELSPGGAQGMIEAGVLNGVDVIYGIHLWSAFPAGHVYSAEGPVMAIADEFAVNIVGKGGHGGLPHDTVDAVMIASHLVVNLQTVVSRLVDPLQPSVISVGSIKGGSAFNVIADTCTLLGTVRTFNESLRLKMERHIARTAEQTCAMFGAGCELDYKWGYPPVVNEANEAARFFTAAAGEFGESYVHRCSPMMVAEDFSYYLQRVPGCFMFVGAGSAAKGIVSPHHHPTFDIDEDALLTGARLLRAMTLHYMDNSPQRMK